MAAAGVGCLAPGEEAGTEDEAIEAVALAIALGGDVNAVDDNGETAMHGAAYKNFPRVVQLLADKGARIEVWNRKNKYGWTPISIAEGHRRRQLQALARDPRRPPSRPGRCGGHRPPMRGDQRSAIHSPCDASVDYVAIGGVLSAASRAVACPCRVRHRGGSPSHVDPPAEIDRFEMADPRCRGRGPGRAAIVGRLAAG